MLKKAVKLLRGSVCVRAKSAYPERMLNLCSARAEGFTNVCDMGYNKIKKIWN